MKLNTTKILHKYPTYLKFILIVIILIITLSPIQYNLHAQEKKKSVPKISFGAGGSVGYYDLISESEQHVKWNGGMGYGGALVFESMFNDLFGIHSGIWFHQFKVEIEMKSEDDSGPSSGDTSGDPSYSTETYKKYDVKSNYFTVPIYLMTSFNLNVISLNLLGGVNFSYISETFMSEQLSNNEAASENISTDIGYVQLGVGGGVELKFHVTRFIDIFVTGIGVRYFSDFIENESEVTAYLYEFRTTSGVLFRTF